MFQLKCIVDVWKSKKVQTFIDYHFWQHLIDPVSVQNLFDSRAKTETDQNKFQEDVTEAVNNAERRVCVEQLVTYCEEAMTKAFSKNEQLLDLVTKTSDPASVAVDLEKVAERQHRPKRWNSQECKGPNRAVPQQWKDITVFKWDYKKVSSSKASNSKVPTPSTEKKRKLLIAQQKREKVERQNELA